MKVSHFSVKHPVIIAMLLVVLIVFGFISLNGMNIEFVSDISTPQIYVIAVYPGASAEDVEQDVTRMLEDMFVTLPNFSEVTSSSSNSMCMVQVMFHSGVDPYDMLPEVRQRITEQQDDFPDGLSGLPFALVAGSQMLPVVSFSVEGGNDIAKVTDFVENTLRPRLTAISGVAEVNTSGTRKLYAEVKLRLDDLLAKKISALTVYQALMYGNVSLPAGNVEFQGKDVALRYDGDFSSIEDIKFLPIGQTENNEVIRIGDVADVALKYPKENYYVTNDKNKIIMVEITKRADGNVVNIVKEVKKILKNAEGEVGNALKFEIISDNSATVMASLKTVVSSGVSGILMAVIVVFLFLNNFRTTLIIGLSIPISLLFTFIGLKLMGITVNLMSLSGMVVALGMIVDGSIVMIEQVNRYYTQKNEFGDGVYTLNQCVFIGSDEVGVSIFASAATTMVVFIPISVLPGIVGGILKDVSLTITLAIFASFLAAVIVVPFLMKVLLKEDRSHVKEKRTLFMRAVDKVERLYRKMLTWALNARKFIIVIAFAVMFVSIFMVGMVGMTFLPSTDNSEFFVNIDFPMGYTLEQTDEKMAKVKKLVYDLVPEIKTTAFFSGRGESVGQNLTAGGTSYQAYGQIVLVPVAERKRDIHTIIRQLQNELTRQIPDGKIVVKNGGFDRLLGFVSDGGGFAIKLLGEDFHLLYKTAKDLEAFLKSDREVVTTAIDTSFDNPTLVLDVSREYIGSLGVSSYEAGVTSNIIFMGMDVGRFRNEADDKRYEITLMSDAADKPVTMDSISSIEVFSSKGTPISFANISDTHIQQELSRINKINRQKSIQVSATLISEDTTGLSDRVDEYFERNPLPTGISIKGAGLVTLLGDTIPALLGAIGIACFLVYTVMVLQFERFRQPFLIMASIPFCLIGVIIGLLGFGSMVSIMAMLGVVALAGTVVNNGIILVDYMNLLRSNAKAAGKMETRESLEECIVEAAASRIRPIFMTTLTTMLGVIPMAIATGEGAEIYAPLGQAISGGLLTSTLITLFLIPILYYISEKRLLVSSNLRSIE